MYLDPILKSHYDNISKGDSKDEILPYDLFKADLYSLGLTFFEIMIG